MEKYPVGNETNEVQCPSCGESISIAEALAAEIEGKYEKSFQTKIAHFNAELKRKTEDLDKEKSVLQTQKDLMQKEIEKQVGKEKLSLEKKLKEELLHTNYIEMEDLKHRLSEKESRLEIALQNELDLRKKARELEEKEQLLEIEAQRKFDEEKKRLSEDVAKRVSEDYRQKALEKDKQLEDMRKQIEDLKRKSELGSQQNQGEVLELEIETLLRSLFPQDTIEPVPKGMRGADVIHKVITPSGQTAGTLVWEMKQTKTWSDGWIEKLKDDQRAITAEFAIIVSSIMPKGISHLGQLDGVWITDLSTAAGLAYALRSQTIQLFHARNMAAGKSEKMEFIYHYLTGTQFRQRVEAIVESFEGMKEDLEKEKRAILKAWAVREQQITRMISSTVGMVGDIQGIVGTSFPKIPSLEFDQTQE